MSEGTVRQWCRMFEDGWTDVHDEERVKWSAVCSEWLSCSKRWPKNCGRWCFIISELLCEFPQISCTLLYKKIITVRLGCHKFCTRWVPEMLTGVHKMLWMAAAFVDFFEGSTTKMAMNFSITLYEWQVMKSGFNCECWNWRAVKVMDASTFTKQAEKV
jgi:hypothetical protein